MSGITLALSGGTEIASLFEQNRAAEVEEQSLKAKENQEQISTLDKENREMTQASKALSSQQAFAAARGVGGQSSVVKAVDITDLDNLNQDLKSDQINLNFNKSQLDEQIEATRAREASGIFGGLVNFGDKFFNSLNTNSNNSTSERTGSAD